MNTHTHTGPRQKHVAAELLIYDPVKQTNTNRDNTVLIARF